ncbi:MAG: type I 3-dehydroquinate dehydratase [Bacteroidota bacterium]|nr:type I 3-dehydroquinate dehydratase [Bacteroidota bacterium]MDP4225879.1 type I 3-dehydroquinate dehydratase [Bacteroidota bacterium]MDP4273370.1 type I 3-dehydroquinate dehydratase [Bacteroidota bacterium]
MICISFCEPDFAKCLYQVKKEELAEIRLDLVDYSEEEIKQIFSCGTKLIATCRAGKFTDEERKAKLVKAIESGAAYVDIELESTAGYRQYLMQVAKRHNCQVIISFHDFEKTPALFDLLKVIETASGWGADITKIACMVNDIKDVSRLLGLYNSKGKIVAFGMGDKGQFSRVASLILGAEFTFAVLDESKQTAPGQLTKQQVEKALDFLNNLKS